MRNQIIWCGAETRSVKINWVQRAAVQNILHTPPPNPKLWSVHRHQVLKYFLYASRATPHFLFCRPTRPSHKNMAVSKNDFWSDGPKPKNISLLWTRCGERVFHCVHHACRGGHRSRECLVPRKWNYRPQHVACDSTSAQTFFAALWWNCLLYTSPSPRD